MQAERRVTTTETTRYEVTRRPRRWVALLGLVPLVGGMIETNSRIENDLEDKAVALGATSASFSVQDGEICAPDVDAVAAALRDVTGVASVEVADDCAPAAPADEPVVSETTVPATVAPVTTAPATLPPASTAPAARDIPTLASETDGLATLTSLVGAAGLADELSGPGPFTVFAPTDEAFEALDPDLLAAVQADPDLLAQVLQYHVVAGEVRAADLSTGSVDTLQGEELDVTVGDSVTIDADGSATATVVMADVEASNGVVHVIDTVLIPPSLRPGAAPAAAATALDAVAAFDGAGIILTGTVDDEAQRTTIVEGAVAAMGGDATKVTDQMTVAATPASEAVTEASARATNFAALLATLPTNFASGEATVDNEIGLRGTALDDAAKATAEAAAATAGAAPADVSVEVREAATAADRDQLIADLNALFLERTIQFAQSSAEIQSESFPLLDDAAAALKQFDLTGIVIDIEGHTDADGSNDNNLRLSQDRAEAVQEALVERGIDEAALNPIGYGEERPIAPNDTAENKARNRRVTFTAQQ
jgi:uncharacterized surface protein with fasciclin (FAS1) repeats/outer membrane protein OmpA-like peptidoglycan-associated protein